MNTLTGDTGHDLDKKLYSDISTCVYKVSRKNEFKVILKFNCTDSRPTVEHSVFN